MAENATLPVTEKGAAETYSFRIWLSIAVVFVISRILYWHAGLRFDASPVEFNWQFIDPILMKTRLLESLFYLHMQPPGFNFFIGVIVKLFPDSYSGVLHVIYLGMGLAIAFSLLHLMNLFRVPELLAAGLVALFIVNPGFVLYENVPFYEYPITVLLILAAVSLFRLCEAPTIGRSLLFFGLLFGVAMLRNLFHILFVVLIMGALMLLLPKFRRIILIGAMPALALILAVQTKNWILFRSFTTSTWAGMTTGVVTTFQLTPDEAQRLVDRGVITPLGKIPPFSDLSLYKPFVHPVAPTGIPILDQPSATGHPNFNDLEYLQIHGQYLKNSEAIWLHYPIAYVRSVAIAWFAYFLPTSDMHSFDDVLPKLRPFERIYNVVVFGQFRHSDSRKGLRAILTEEGALPLLLYTGTFLLIGLPLLVVWTLLQFRQRARGRWSLAERTVLGFIILTVLFSTAVSNSLSTFENNRYRFPLDPYYTLLAGLAITSMILRKPGAREQRREIS